MALPVRYAVVPSTFVTSIFVIFRKTGSSNDDLHPNADIISTINNNRCILDRRLKNRFVTQLSDTLELELDVYLNSSEGLNLEGLQVAEIEFPSTDAKEDFSNDTFTELGYTVSRDLTEDSAYSNQQLALNGLKGLI